MKKILSCILIAVLLATTAIPAFAAQINEPAAESESTDLPIQIVFVNGIGQLWSHLIDENGNYKTAKDKNSEIKMIEYNLFYTDWSAFKQPRNTLALARAVLELFVLSPLLDRNMISKRVWNTFFEALFNRNIIDKNGDLPPDVEPAARNYPLSAYNEVDKANFYHSIPCRDQLDGIGEENVYCYYHSAFSFLERDADGLDAFINDVVLKDRPAETPVVLVPMSMGATVVSAYLAKYGDKGQVKRVVSIVGAWNGSDLVADLIEHKYSVEAPELLYHTVLPEVIGDPWGHLLCCFLYSFSQKTLRSILDTILSSLVETIVLRTPSLLALIPAERYPAIEEKYLSGDEYAYIREQTRAYYEAQRTLPQRMARLQTQGTEFYFISGYGLPFGGADESEFSYFRFMQSAETTNSDEIISISSTAPGAVYAPAGQSLGRTGRYISPDGSVDLSTSFAPDRTWLFYRQKHQLDYNNTALQLAMDIAVGKVTDVASGADKYPQFNARRDAKPLIKGNDTYLDRLKKYIDANAGDPQKAAEVARARDALARCSAMLEDTHNDPEADAAVIAYAAEVLSELYPEPEPKAQKWSERVLNGAVEKLHEWLYRTFGAAGWRDKYAFR
ncbi:MAG: hypothetical protein IJT41_02705 [Clostridia bacterium]|nr:hypothetical protein [Clostridia bacterium]